MQVNLEIRYFHPYWKLGHTLRSGLILHMVNGREKLIAGQDNLRCLSQLLLKLAWRTLTLTTEFPMKNSIHLRKKKHSLSSLISTSLIAVGKQEKRAILRPFSVGRSLVFQTYTTFATSKIKVRTQ